MKKEDAAFSVPFSLTLTRNDYVHALVRARPAGDTALAG